VEVVRVRWPAEADRRAGLAARGVARLLLVEHGEPPVADDCLEDWLRVPAPEADVEARVVALGLRLARHHPGGAALDGDGVLRVGDRWVALPPVEARLAAALLERQGAVVSRAALSQAGWPEGSPGRNALDVHVLRLRRRIAAVGLAIRTVRSRGYLLEWGPGRPTDGD
jgi:DNA-binding response OmpR family regulator